MNTTGNFIVDVLLALIPVVMSYAFYYFKKYVKNPLAVKTLESIANSAVIYAEQIGIAQRLSGSQQFVTAVKKAQDELVKLGITNVDVDLIKATVEKAWVANKSALDKAYAGAKQDQKSAELQAQQQELETKKSEIDKAQAELDKSRADMQVQAKAFKDLVAQASQTLAVSDKAVADMEKTDKVEAQPTSTADTDSAKAYGTTATK